MKEVPQFTISQAPVKAELTTSPVIGLLVKMALEDLETATPRRSIDIDFDGDADKAHQRTKSWRRVASRLGYVLRTRLNRDQKKLTLWVTKNV